MSPQVWTSGLIKVPLLFQHSGNSDSFLMFFEISPTESKCHNDLKSLPTVSQTHDPVWIHIPMAGDLVRWDSSFSVFSDALSHLSATKLYMLEHSFFFFFFNSSDLPFGRNHHLPVIHQNDENKGKEGEESNICFLGSCSFGHTHANVQEG